MTPHTIEFNSVSFSYDSMSESLLQNLSLQFSNGWTGIVGPNGCGKTTLMKLATGQLEPKIGIITINGITHYCQQRTDSKPNYFKSFLNSLDRYGFLLKGKLKIEDDWLERWSQLSHGERKRAQIGTALWIQPEILAIDEPTNHLDNQARDYLMSALQTFKGIGLLVSHDKNLLDLLCENCVFIDPPDFDSRRGNFSDSWQQIQNERRFIEKQHSHAKKEYKKLDRLVKKQRHKANTADSKKSKKKIGKKDHDAKSKIDLARLSGKDATAGKLMNQLTGRRKQAQEKFSSIQVKKTYETGIWQDGEVSPRNSLFSLPVGTIEFGQLGCLEHPQLNMKPSDRIALIGDNGTGKSTLINFIFESLSLPSDRVTYIPQEIDMDRSITILNEARHLPSDKLGVMMTAINRLGTRPPRLLESTEPSPGETRKMLLSIGIAHIPHLIIMDEPTNHLDLVSIECLKDALKEYAAGLLLVSHDMEFLNGLTNQYWHIYKHSKIKHRYKLEIKYEN